MSKEQLRGSKQSVRSNSATGRSKKGTQVQPALDEAEAMRQQLLADVGEVEEAPGQLDSLLDRAYLADCFFEEHVLQDPACLRSPELFREAWAVAQALADFYQKVGQEVGKEPIAGTATGGQWNSRQRRDSAPQFERVILPATAPPPPRTTTSAPTR